MDNTKVYDFIENTEMFHAFLKYSKDEFFEKYSYLTQEEYDLTLSVFNKDAVNILITFIENTSSNILTEPYNLTPKECNKTATIFAKKVLQPKEWDEFVKTAKEKNIKLIF